MFRQNLPPLGVRRTLALRDSALKAPDPPPEQGFIRNKGGHGQNDAPGFTAATAAPLRIFAGLTGLNSCIPAAFRLQ